MLLYNPHRHHRRFIRLQGYDYSRVGELKLIKT